VSIENLNHVWPKWQVVEQLGEGSFGKVYKVVRTEHTLISYAAVKVISIPQSTAELESMRAEGLNESGTRSYFEGIVTDCVNEIKLMESMKGNTNVVSVEDYKVLEKKEGIGWDIFIRMELLTPLSSYIADKQLSEAEVIKIGQDVCAALYLCSQLNIIHRDIKPENIFVSPFGDFKVGDFGIARELETSGGSLSQKGTYNYMAPEVVASRRYDATVDLYSLGLVLFKLLNNNRMPFLDPYTQLIQHQDRKNAIEHRLSGEALPVPVNASPYMTQVIHKACSFNPSERFQTPFDFREALGATKGDSPPACTPRPNYDETTAVRSAPQSAQSLKPHPKESASFVKKKKSKAKRVLVPICLLLIVAGVIAGFIINQYSDSGRSSAVAVQGASIVDNTLSGSEIVYDEDADEQYAEAEGVLYTQEVQGVRLVDVSRLAANHARAEWITDKNHLPRKIDEFGNVKNTYTNGLRMSPRPGGFRSTRLNWSDSHSYFSFDIAVSGNGGAVILIESVESEPTLIWERRTIPPGQIVSVRNLNVSESGGGIRVHVRSANDQNIDVWILDPVLSMTEVSGGSAQDNIVGLLEVPLPTNTPMPTNTPIPTNSPTPLPTETAPNDEPLEEHGTILESNGVSLSTVEVISSNFYRASDQLFISSSGHRYRESFDFSVSTLGDYFDNAYSYVIYDLNDNYTAFFAEVVAPINLDENLEFLIEIAFDDAAPVVTIEGFNVSMATVPVELDVTGVTSMYIIVRGRGGSTAPHDSIRIGNATLQ